MLDAIKSGRAPKRFTTRYLESLGFKGPSDRLLIGVLKSLELLTDQGEPTQRYHEFLDQTQSKTVLAQAVEDAYEDLFQINRKAYDLPTKDVVNKMKTLSQGEYSDAVLTKMATTFKALSAWADWTAARKSEDVAVDEGESEEAHDDHRPVRGGELRLGGLVYNVQLVLPESRDPAVYDALFRSLREHLR